MKGYQFRTIEGRKHVLMTAKEWKTTPSDYKGTVLEESRLHTELGWSVGAKVAMIYDNGTCLMPVHIEG